MHLFVYFHDILRLADESEYINVTFCSSKNNRVLLYQFPFQRKRFYSFCVSISLPLRRHTF